MAVKENAKIAKAKEEYECLTGDETVQRLAFLREKWERDHKSELLWEKRKAQKEGREIGEKIGEKIGKKIGEKIGKELERKNIIKEMIKKQITDELIIGITKITEEELAKIKEEMKEK